MVAAHDGKKHDLYGRQVGGSSILIILAELVRYSKTVSLSIVASTMIVVQEKYRPLS